jgi:hypothetical protein
LTRRTGKVYGPSIRANEEADMHESEEFEDEGELITDPAEIELMKAHLQYTSGQYETGEFDY